MEICLVGTLVMIPVDQWQQRMTAILQYLKYIQTMSGDERDMTYAYACYKSNYLKNVQCLHHLYLVGGFKHFLYFQG